MKIDKKIIKELSDYLEEFNLTELTRDGLVSSSRVANFRVVKTGLIFNV